MQTKKLTITDKPEKDSFIESIVKHARSLKINGWIQKKSDSIEIIAQGEEKAIIKLKIKCHAEDGIDEVIIQNYSTSSTYHSFVIKH